MGLPTSDDLYTYDPHVGAAILFLILFTIWTGWHGYLCIYSPLKVTYKHRYTIPLCVAAILSAEGYGFRIASIHTPSSISVYAQSSGNIVIAPIFICATLYLLLTYIIRLTLPPNDQKVYGILPKWLGRIFIASDIMAFLTQGTGSAVSGAGDWTGLLNSIGIKLLLFGLALQLATFTAFLLFLHRFVTRVRNSSVTGFNPCTRKVLTGVWIASAAIQIRTIYRLVEFAMGFEGYLFQHEWPLYIFESVPVWIALGVLGWCHPVKWLQQRPRHEFTEEARNSDANKDRDSVQLVEPRGV